LTPSRRRFPLRACLALALLIALLTWRGACMRSDALRATWTSPPLAEGEYQVLAVAAADTLELRRGAGKPAARVRMLGVSAGNSDRRIAETSRQWTKRRLEKGVCRLEFDKRRLDGEGAYLAYVYVEGALLNEELLRAGLARADARPDDSPSLARRFARAEAEAQAARRGIWAGDYPNSK
jgi:micrococcal nuclease